jgi:hypothetical protein
MGRNNSPVDSTFAYTMAGTRQLLQSAQLASAALVAVTDLNFQRITRNFNGLPQVNTINKTLRTLMTLPDSERAKLALRLSLTPRDIRHSLPVKCATLETFLAPR